MVINHTYSAWKRLQASFGRNKYNGALYYSQEICENIIPNVKTDRNWITVNIKGYGADHAIVFVHSNLTPKVYDWLKRYKDLVLVCGIPETVEKVSYLGKAIYLPLSIDVDHVKQFCVPEDERSGTAFVGRESKARYEGARIPPGTDYLCNMPRDQLLRKMAHYKSVYAVGRCAIEAKALGLEVLPYDPRYPDPDVWKVVDNKDAAEMLQTMLDDIDRGQTMITSHEHPLYKYQRSKIGASRWNGAYYYSVEIVNKIIPNVKTDRPWITVNIKEPTLGFDRAIVFVHNHKQCPKTYEWLKGYKDLIFVCSEKDDMPKLEYLGTPIYLPLSVDVEYVKQFRKDKKTKELAFVGRRERAGDIADHLPGGIEYVSGMRREQLLRKLADYKTVYALDRVAIEAQILGCNVLPWPDRWKVIDTLEAAEMLQKELDKIDGQIAETEGT